MKLHRETTSTTTTPPQTGTTIKQRSSANVAMSPLTLSSMMDGAYVFAGGGGGQSLKSDGGLLLEASKLKNDSFSSQQSLTKLPASLASQTSMTVAMCHESQKLKIRFLIFVEDAEGVRYNIFDSGKSSQLKSTTSGKSNGQMNSPISSYNNSNQASSASNASTSPISSKLNNEMLTRMVFGSFPMVVSNRTAIKVHSLK